MWNKDASNASRIENLIPSVFCLENIQCLPADTGGFNYRATLYHEHACILVSFYCAEFDTTLENGQFVTVSWLPTMQSSQGAIQVAGLAALKARGGSDDSARIDPEKLNAAMNAPHSWASVDRHLVNCARSLWQISSKEMRRMMFATVIAQTVRSEHGKW